MKTHMRDIRLRNNAGIDFPVCCRNAPALDLDKSRYPTTGNIKEVDCKRCLKSFPRLYPWASGR